MLWRAVWVLKQCLVLFLVRKKIVPTKLLYVDGQLFWAFQKSNDAQQKLRYFSDM